jgi:hypothetical protein
MTTLLFCHLTAAVGFLVHLESGKDASMVFGPFFSFLELQNEGVDYDSLESIHPARNASMDS